MQHNPRNLKILAKKPKFQALGGTGISSMLSLLISLPEGFLVRLGGLKKLKLLLTMEHGSVTKKNKNINKGYATLDFLLAHIPKFFKPKLTVLQICFTVRS